MMQIREISFTRLAGFRASIALNAFNSMELLTCASDSTVCSPSTDIPALVQKPVILLLIRSLRLRSQVHLHPLLHRALL